MTNVDYPTSSALPFQVSGDYYPIPPKGAPSLAYLLGDPGLLGYTPEEGLYIASIVPLKKSVDDKESYSTISTKNIVFVKFYPSGTFGVANMERVGVVQIGHNPSTDYFDDLGYANRIQPGDELNKNYIIWWGSDIKPEEIYLHN